MVYEKKTVLVLFLPNKLIRDSPTNAPLGTLTLILAVSSIVTVVLASKRILLDPS